MKDIADMSQRIALGLAVAPLNQQSHEQWADMPIEQKHPLM